MRNWATITILGFTALMIAGTLAWAENRQDQINLSNAGGAVWTECGAYDVAFYPHDEASESDAREAASEYGLAECTGPQG